MKKKKNPRFLNDQKKGKPDPNKNSRKRAIGIIAIAVVLAIAAGVWWFLDYTKDEGLIYPNVFVFGTDLGGMAPEDAAATLRQLTGQTYTVQTMVVNLPDVTLALTPTDTGAQVDVDALVKLCYDYGRGGNRWENTRAKAEAALTTYEPDTAACIRLDVDAIRESVERAAAAAASTLTQPQVAVTGETPDLNLTYEKAQEKTDVTHKQLTIVLGTPERSLNTEALMETILDAYYANDFTPIDFAYDVTEPDQPDLDAIHLEHTIAPVDAVLDETDYSISHEVLGYSFDLEALKQQVAEAGEGQTVTISFQYTPAAVTWASIDATLFKDVLGSVSTNHTNDSNRNTNLKLAAKAINGKLIRPGETFSYNQTLGERTEKKGYKPAGAYMAGKTVETVGGGICQVSSTLYYACLKADLQIVERTAHGYTVSYMPYGMDATVSWGSLDYKFKNNTDYPIRIEAWVSGGQVHVKLIGTDTKDYYVKMTYETVEGPTEGKVVYEDYKWDNKEGYKDGEVLQTAYTGRTVKSYRQKFDKATDKLISSEYEATSRYKSRDKIIARVEPKPQPTEPATEPTTASVLPADPIETENGA
ncbi:MAG: VanW family protein [Oscillospiraceae bacterium]|nr:VanW family protein [Oscillospiraceae bacterium]